MFILGLPSISAYTLLSNFESDWPRKLAVLALALVAVQDTGSELERYATVAGILFSITLLAANLGARAWHFMKWKFIRRGGPFASVLSFFVATVVGLCFPYMGFGKIQAGGKAALQLVIYNSLIVALIFVVSDVDSVQKFLVVGSEVRAVVYLHNLFYHYQKFNFLLAHQNASLCTVQNCNQDSTNIALGVWFTLTVITCIFAALKIEPPKLHPEDNDPILVEDQTSPVGFKVPNFPDYPIDPLFFGKKGLSFCSLKTEIIIGIVISIFIGVAVALAGMFTYVEPANDFIEKNMGGVGVSGS